MEKLNIKALAVGLGISWAVCMLFVGWASIFGWGTKFVEIMSSVYIGFTPTFLGGIIGAIWGFIDGAIGGAIIALVYNVIVKKK
ncbi:MAG: bacteriophage holin [Methanosarcinales archaeon]